MCTRICLCVLCGLPAAGKSTLAQAVNSHSVQRGWRSAVISYDDLIPEDAFNVKEVEDEEDIPRSQTVHYKSKSCLYQCRLLRTVDAQLPTWDFLCLNSIKSALLNYTTCKATAIRQHFTRGIKREFISI